MTYNSNVNTGGIFMYKNVGKKIQTFAKVVAWVGIILTGGLGLLCIALYPTEGVNMLINGILLLITGPLISWLSSLTLVGFGKLVEDNETMKNQINEINSKINNQNTNE